MSLKSEQIAVVATAAKMRRQYSPNAAVISKNHAEHYFAEITKQRITLKSLKCTLSQLRAYAHSTVSVTALPVETRTKLRTLNDAITKRIPSSNPHVEMRKTAQFLVAKFEQRPPRKRSKPQPEPSGE
jgi:hypothetical protein